MADTDDLTVLARRVAELITPYIDQAVTSSVNASLARARITKFVGGSVADADGDVVYVAPDDDPSALIEATRCSASQVAGTRVLLIFSSELRGAVYAVGVIP
jgi:hypothetical protein